MHKLEFYKQAAKYYSKLDTKTQRRINIAVDEMVKNPLKGPHIKKLKGRLEGKYRGEDEYIRWAGELKIQLAYP